MAPGFVVAVDAGLSVVRCNSTAERVGKGEGVGPVFIEKSRLKHAANCKALL
jgi:hypothetical protein